MNKVILVIVLICLIAVVSAKINVKAVKEMRTKRQSVSAKAIATVGDFPLNVGATMKAKWDAFLVWMGTNAADGIPTAEQLEDCRQRQVNPEWLIKITELGDAFPLRLRYSEVQNSPAVTMRIAQTGDALGRSADTQCLSGYVELPANGADSNSKLAWVHGKGEVGFSCPAVAADKLMTLFERVSKSFGIGTVTAALDDGSHIYCTDSTDTSRQLDLYVLFPAIRLGAAATSYYSRYNYIPTCATYAADLTAVQGLTVGQLPAATKLVLQTLAATFGNTQDDATAFDISKLADRTVGTFFALAKGYVDELTRIAPLEKAAMGKVQCDATWAAYSSIQAPDATLPAGVRTAVDHLKSGTCRLMTKVL